MIGYVYYMIRLQFYLNYATFVLYNIIQCAFCGLQTTATEIAVIENIFGLNPEQDSQMTELQKMKESILDELT